MDLDGVKSLLSGAGVDSRRLRHALALLCDGQWWTLPDLVRETATSRRSIEALLREVELERSGDRCRVPIMRAPSYQEFLALAPPPQDPVGHLLPHYEPVLRRLRDLVDGAPRARHSLDHVAATPETVLRRALLLGTRFWLPGSRLLCVGDHDLTSLAVKLVHPEAEVTVVDVDDRILAYLDAQGLGVRTRWADLRLSLPPSARDHDLAATDPPYTPDGVGLFVARAIEGLGEDGRVVLAYGVSERTPALALKVQNSLSALNLTYEAIYPDFNRYYGAEAIGSAADLYVLRPTAKTRPAVTTRLDRLTTAIYTQGPQSVESAAPQTVAPGSALDGFDADLLVGDWPKESPLPRARLSTWLSRPHASAPRRVAVAVPPGLESALPRLLLATRAERVRAVVAGRPEIPGVLSAVYDITPGDGVLDAVRLPQPAGDQAAVLRRILDNAHAKLANTWRESLVAVARGQGATLTKNDARALIRQAAPWSEDITPLEAPLHRLSALPAAVAATVTALSETV